MAKGIFIFKYSENSQSEILDSYFTDESESESNLSKSLLKTIADKHLFYNDTSARLKRSHSYRTDDKKYYSVFIARTNDEDKIFLNFILDLSESVEPFSISIGEMKKSIKNSIEEQEPPLKDVLRKLLATRNQIVDDIEDPQRITDRLVSQANKLLDEGEFQNAQKLIKRGKELPPKIAALVKRGNDAFEKGDLKLAQKSFNEAADLAVKINQSSMNELLKRKAKRAEEIPKFNKNWDQLYDKLSKILKKMEKHEVTFYLEPINQVNKAIEISDMLEDDDTIATLQKLEDLLQKGESLTKKIEEVNSEIREIMDSLKSG